MVNKKNHVRIIAGKFRGRKLQFPDVNTLRPTPDKIKETLFNWIGPHIIDAHCLDCFAGSGSLGFEAISRGATHVTFIEKNANASTAIEENSHKLGTDASVQIIQRDALQFLQFHESKAADIIFLDPPYQQALLYQTLELIKKYQWVHAESLIYVEDDKPITVDLMHWKINRQGKAGNVYYALLMNSH